MAKVFDEEINKNTDWGGDESTGNLPVSGRRVQEFIKKQLNGKAGLFYYDTANNRYIVFADEVNRDLYLANPGRTDLIIATFDAPFNYSAQITLSTPAYVAIIAGGKNNYIDFTFDTMNKQGQSVGEDVICTYTFIKGGIKKTVTEKYRYGASVHFNIDEYIGVGTNTITVGIVGQNTLAATTIGITYQVVDLQLSDTYDISQVYNLVGNPIATAAIPYQISGYGTKIMEWYLDGELLEYVKVEDEIVDVSATRTKYISLANLSQGIHSLQYRAYTILDGEKFYSNILYRDLIVNVGANKNPIVAVAVTIPVGNDIITSEDLPLYGLTQYIPYDLIFAVYNPSGVASTDAVIVIDDKLEASLMTRNNEVFAYSLRPTEYGVKKLTITAGDTVYAINLNIAKSSTSLEAVTDGLQLDLMALGKSNNDVNREEWGYGLYSAAFTGFNWNKTSGWNNNRLLISSGAYVDVNFAPLYPDPTATGKTLEFEFSTKNVSVDDAVICDLRNCSGTGLLITASEVKLKSAGGAEVSTKFKSEENIRVALVINKKSGVANKCLAFVYVNGICSGAVNYSATDNFTSDKILRIGETASADVALKALRFYNAALTSDQVLNNYILYRDTTEELLSVYDKNNIYEEGTQTFSVDKLSAQCPVFIFTGDIPALENTTDKNKTIYVDVEYINMQDPSKSFKGRGIRLRPQGTSSMGYPKKNFRPYTGYGTMWDSLGNVIQDGLYAFRAGAQPVNVWCLKADYAESSGTHNTGIARLWNQAMTNAQLNGEYILRTDAQKAAVGANYPYDVRTTVDGFPCNVFYRLTADSDLVYIGKYNFNNDKSTESVFGFRDIPGFDNSKMQCWEVLNNGNHLALFQDTTNFDTEWDKAYEARYPDGSTDVSDLKSFSEWVVSTKNDLTKFKAEKWNHLDVYKVAAYYVYLMRFGAVDQVVKNAMLTSEDGAKFYFINYDNDTINSVRNDGLLIYNYDIDRQTVDSSFSALVYAYAGHDSTLWNNLEADEEFMRIVSEVDNALYMAGLSYEKVIDMFDNQQSGKWCERIYNQDAQYKYVGPYTDSGINNLFMLQGSRSAHRRWWLSRRFDLLDSKFVSGAYKAKSIEFKAANAPSGLRFSITSGNNIYYGYGLNNVPVETGIRLTPGESHSFTTKQVINVGDPVRIYSAINVQELDIHEFIGYLSVLNIAEVYNDSVGTKFRKLVLGVDTATDNRRNTSMSSISGLSQAKRLEYLDISGYQAITNLDLSAHNYLKTLKAYESGLTGLALASGCPVTNMELPDTMQAIDFDNLPKLGGGFSIKNFGRHINSITIKKCNLLDSKTLVFNWNSSRLTEDSMCSLTLEGINWTNVDATSLVSLGDIKDAGGILSMKGKIVLDSVTLEQLTRLKEIFGDNCTEPDNELFIKAPDGIYLTGPFEVIEDNTAQYSAAVFSDHFGSIVFTLVNGTTEVLSYQGATIDAATGLVTIIEKGYDYQMIVRAKHIPTKGAVVRSDMVVSVKKRIYPSKIEIDGPGKVETVGSYEYTISPTPLYPEITGEYKTEWSLSGPAFEQGLVELGTNSKNDCIVNILSTVPEITTCSLTATLKKLNDTVIITGVRGIDLSIPGVIMTNNSNPEVMDVCYKQGWAAHETYMTDTEASNVTNIGQAFVRCQMKQFDEFQYFTGVTQITGNYGNFSDCSRMASITLPNSLLLIYISNYTLFRDCYALKELIIPDSVTRVDGLVSGCRALESITLPSAITFIYRIENCANLKVINGLENATGLTYISGINSLPSLESFYIPASVTYISYSFSNCPKVQLICPEDNTKYKVEKNSLIDRINNEFISCPNTPDGNVVIPDGIIKIASSAFAGSNLASIEFPSSVTNIDGSAFSGCKSLLNITFPDSITNIDSSNIFSNCSNLESVAFPKVMRYFPGNSSRAFQYCTKLVSVKFPDTVDGAAMFSEDCFAGCIALTSLVLGDYDIRSIDRRAFSSCESLQSITVSGLKSLNDYSLNYCPNLSTITLKNSSTAPSVTSASFGDNEQAYTGRNTYDKGTNMLYVPSGATGYDSGQWLDPLQDATKCGFTISYTL